jgi:hypothetical protein
MKKALEDKDIALADAQKVAREKTEAAERKLAAAGKLEEENTNLKKEKAELSKALDKMTKRRDGLERFIGKYAEKMYGLLEGNSFLSNVFLSGASSIELFFLLNLDSCCRVLRGF